MRAVAQTFRENPSFDTEKCLTELKTGEALLSFLQEDGSPFVVQRATILPPQSSIGPVSDELRKTFMETDLIGTKYDQAVDRQSAYEILAAQFQAAGVQETQVLSPVPTQMEQVEAPQPVYQPMTFRVYNPETGKYEEKAMGNMQLPVLQAQPLPQNTVTRSDAYRYNLPAQQDAVVLPAKEEKKKKQPAKKRSEMTQAEQLFDSFTKSISSSAGREVGRSLSRTLLGILGLKKK